MTQPPFIPVPGQNYKRGAIHDEYGGNRQNGISPSKEHPYIFIFSNKSGQKHGYENRWLDNNEFLYSGHGQTGDMKFAEGNLALRNHLQNGKKVFFFEGDGKGNAKFISELEFLDLDFFRTHDTNGKTRTGIRFHFKTVGISLPIQPELIKPIHHIAEPLESYNKRSDKIEELLKSKVGQGDYLQGIIRRWNYKCAVSGLNKLNLLIASNIEPWPEDDQPERQDIDNGILLSPTYDTLFEKHLISFKDSGKIMLSHTIEKSAFQKLGISGKESIKDLNDYNKIYLDKHRSRFHDAH